MKPITNIAVYGLWDSVRASKYPMATDLSKLNEGITAGVLARGACPKGTGHDQFLTGIICQFDLTFSIKAWTEAERYHFLDFVSSQSTMHRICRFDISQQCNEYVLPEIVKAVETLVDGYNDDPTPEKYLKVLYNLPVGFQLTARMTTNYRQLKTIYAQRRDHRLPEWREFCEQLIEELPMFKELCIGGEGE